MYMYMYLVSECLSYFNIQSVILIFVFVTT